MPLAHLLAPLIVKKTREIEGALSPPMQGAGYLHDVAPVSEAQGYAQMDRERAAAIAGLDMKAKAREAFDAVGTPRRGTLGPLGATDADISSRVARLAQMDKWTADDLRGLPSGAVDAASALRSQSASALRKAEARGPLPGKTINVPGYLPQIGGGKNKRVTVDTYHPLMTPPPDMRAPPGSVDMTPRAPTLTEKLRKTAPTIDAYADEIARDLEQKRMRLGYLDTAY